MEVMKLFCLLVFADAMTFKERFLKITYESYHMDSYHMAHVIWVIWGQGSRTHYQKDLIFSNNHWVRRTGFRRKVVIILNTAI